MFYLITHSVQEMYSIVHPQLLIILKLPGQVIE